jgi:Type II CAAX prenyl endopeptidase Rce1-like
VTDDVIRGRLLLWATALVAALAVGLPAFRPELQGRASVLVGPAVGAGLFLGLAGTRFPEFRAPTIARAAWLGASAAFEELAWRAVALAVLAAWMGVLAALVVTSVGFAAAHQARLGRRARVHVLTGAGFGAAFVCAGLVAAIAAHWVYNLLVDLALRGEREPG